MKTITNKELALKLAGGDSYIRTKDNIVQGLAITTDKNPEAPEIIVVGVGPKIVSNAKLFLEQQQYVPVYVKQAVKEWKYLGEYKADNYSQDIEVIEKHRKHRAIRDVNGILFLSSKDDLRIEITSTLFPDQETKKKVEVSAINFVSLYYENLGFIVTDRQKDNCGYDLLVEKSKEVLKIEVKGTSLSKQRFFLSRNERAKSADPLWRLVIVVNALLEPELEVFNTTEMENKFNFDALSWECNAR